MIRKISKDSGAFTLIELLIVVAIIAILAAIAVPNFLEAQTRAKVSRVRADMRTVATASELYRVDNNRYPTPSDAEGNLIQNPSGSSEAWYETKTPVLLTTPIAYMTMRPRDIFAPAGTDDAQNFHYTTLDYIRLSEGHHAEEVFGEFYEELKGTLPPQPVQWSMLSFGPDQDHDVEHGGDGHGHHGHHHAQGDHGDHGDHSHPAIYDPSNGTISNGDIHYMAPAPGFL